MSLVPETLPERYRALCMDTDAVCAFISRVGVNRVFSAQTFFRLATQTRDGWVAYDHVLYGASSHAVPLAGVHVRFDDGDTFEAIVGQEPADAQDALQRIYLAVHSPWHPLAEIADAVDHAFIHLASIEDYRVDSLLEDTGLPLTRVMVRGKGEKDWNGIAALRFLSEEDVRTFQARIARVHEADDFLSLPWNPRADGQAGRIFVPAASVMGVLVQGAYAVNGAYIKGSMELVVRYGHSRVLRYAYGDDVDAARLAARQFLGQCPQLRGMDGRKTVYLDPTRVQVAVNPQQAGRVFFHFKGGGAPEAVSLPQSREATELVNAVNAAILRARMPVQDAEKPTGAKVIPLRPS